MRDNFTFYSVKYYGCQREIRREITTGKALFISIAYSLILLKEDTACDDASCKFI